ncbi:MAG: ABC transporter ATP-binding protein [Ruminococcaceae bacterium]|nr:ABC transporter ATP-binding protein [Oscillospiraceae bacterium]
MKSLLKYLGKAKLFIAIALIIKVSATLIELAIPYILSHILDNVVPTKSIKTIVFYGIAMIACACLACVGNITANRMAARVARNTTKELRHDLFVRTMGLSSKQIDKYTIPSLESRLTSDTYHVHHFVGMSMRMGVRAPILLVGGLFVTATLDPILTLVMALILPFITFTIYFISRKGIPLFRKIQHSVDGMTRIVREDAQGIRVIKALSKVDYEKRRYDKANKELVADGTRADTTMAVSNPVVTLLLNIGLVSVIVVGAFRVNGNFSEVGKIIAFIQYFTMISMAMRGLARIFIGYTRGAASAQRIAEVINTPHDLEVQSEDKHPRIETDDIITFEDVSFSFGGKKNTVSNISFSLKKGQSIGIIGATGSGKTTLLQLLMRFYDVDSGSIRIEGRDVRTIPHGELNTKFGVVMQNDFIYAGSIRDNVDFGRNIDDAAIRRAARIAQAAEFIEAYDDGYDHMLNSKGTNLSGGQRQRLLITRAVAGDPQILVLDDSSSALDYKTDARLRHAINEELADVTTVIVAQRVSSVMNCDIILVLDDGELIGKGTHEELLLACDVYKEISDSQIGGAFVD